MNLQTNVCKISRYFPTFQHAKFLSFQFMGCSKITGIRLCIKLKVAVYLGCFLEDIGAGCTIALMHLIFW